MSRAKRKRAASRDVFATRGRKGTEMVLTVDTELIKIVDAYRNDVEEQLGVEMTRRQVVEGLMRSAWRRWIVEASALGAIGGAKVRAQLDALKGGGE